MACNSKGPDRMAMDGWMDGQVLFLTQLDFECKFSRKVWPHTHTPKFNGWNTRTWFGFQDWNLQISWFGSPFSGEPAVFRGIVKAKKWCRSGFQWFSTTSLPLSTAHTHIAYISISIIDIFFDLYLYIYIYIYVYHREIKGWQGNGHVLKWATLTILVRKRWIFVTKYLPCGSTSMKTRTPFPLPGCIAASWLHGEMSGFCLDFSPSKGRYK